MADRPDNASEAAGWFELLQEIGSGSSGTVHRARLTRPYHGLPAGTEVAVKFLRPELADDEKARARLFAEGELGQAIDHENVARIYGVEALNLLGVETIYLVMQYVEGTTLRSLLQRSTAPVEDLTRRLGADAASGLSALHRRGLVHRDIKPENLILTPASELKIVDLGLARPFGSSGGGSSPGTSGSRSSGIGLHGSVAYSAPEVLGGRPAGPKSDLYSLGVVLFEVTTGRHPFADATTVDEMLDAHLNRRPPRASHFRPRVSPFLDEILAELLDKDPDRRPRSAAELAHILRQGERSEWWQRHEAKAPVLASGRRLSRMRRPADVAFVDRRTELAMLDKLLHRAQSGHGGVLAIAAPASSGRRRLLDEAMQRWLQDAEPPILLGGDADSGLGQGEPFASSLLDVLLGGDDRHSPNARARAAAAAGKRCSLDDDDAEALGAVLFGDSREPSEVRADRIGAALLALAQNEGTLVIRVDHADDLDTTGRLVLQRLADAAPNRRLLLLLAAGPDTTLVAAENRHELAGLARRDFLLFGRSLFRAPVDEHVQKYLEGAFDVVSGLPGSLLEALERLAEQGRLRGRPGDYHDLAADAEPRPAPHHLERFKMRVATLEPKQRLTLSAAAVLGERCSLADLSAVILEPELSVLETLSLFRGRIVSAQGGEVAFRHRDFRRALLRTLPDEERRRLHAAAASVLEARSAGPLAVGMHRSMALDHQGCLEPLLEALSDRVAAGSRRTALRIAGRLAVHFRHVDDSDANRRLRLRYLQLSGQAHLNADQVEAASRAFRAADRLARELGDVIASAEARVGLANSELDAGRLLSAIALLEAVHDALADPRTVAIGPDSSTEVADAIAAQAHVLHGRILLYFGQAAECARHLTAARKRLPNRPEDLRCHLWIDTARGEALAHRYAHALRTLGEIERAGPVRHHPRVRLRFHLYRGQVRALLGDPDAGQDLRLARDEATRLSLPVYGARAALFLGERALWRGQREHAVDHFEVAVRLAQTARDRLGEALARTHLFGLGAESDANALAQQVRELDLPELHAAWLLANIDRDRAPDDAREQLERLLADFDLPLALHLRALHWLQRPASARALIRRVGERIPQRALRQRFLKMWQRPPRRQS